MKNKDLFSIKNLNVLFFSVFYIIAGMNHFRSPAVYLALIPPYFGYHEEINILCGTLEIMGGILMSIPSTRKIATVLVVMLLIAFIPAHIYLIQMNGCVSKNLCVPAWVAWIRLIPFQFILIWWTWKTYQWNRP